MAGPSGAAHMDRGSDSEDLEDEDLNPVFKEMWKDVDPLYIDDGGKVVAIQYTPEHKKALAYFRAALASGEKSERVLRLTSEMIGFNQADYTAWQIRWLCLKAIGSDLMEEYDFTEGILEKNAKNYQLWNHRRKCALAMGATAAQGEMDVAAEALAEDEKNYHAWAHRQAIMQAFGLWSREIEYVTEMISKDVRNNSAWNQRAFILKATLSAQLYLRQQQHDGRGPIASNKLPPELIGTPLESLQAAADTAASWGNAAKGSESKPDPNILDAEGLPVEVATALNRELMYCASQIQLAPRNESAWNYLIGLFSLDGCRPHELGRHTAVHTICAESLTDCPSCPLALGALMEYYMSVAMVAAEAAANGADAASAWSAVRDAASAAQHCLQQLAAADPLRNMLYMWKGQQIASCQAAAEAALAPSSS